MEGFTPYPVNADLELGPIEDIIVRPYMYEIEDNFRNKIDQRLHIWGLTRESEAQLLIVKNPPVYGCYELPLYTEQTDDMPSVPIIWTDQLVNKVFEYFCYSMNVKKANCVKDNKPKNQYLAPPHSYYYEYRYPVYDMSFYKTPYLFMFFRNNITKYDIKIMCDKPRKIHGIGTIKLINHEAKIDCVRRLMSMVSCKYCQWFSVKGRKTPITYKDRTSLPIKTEFYIDWSTIQPIPTSQTSAWIVNPRIAAIDIETRTSEHRSFPCSMALDNYCYLITIVVSDVENKMKTEKYAILYGWTDPVPGATVLKANTEEDLLVAYTYLIRKVDPDIITGYNINRYDFQYMIDRFNIKTLDIPPNGRILEEKSTIYNTGWESKAHSAVSHTFIVSKGRAIIDTLDVVKRLYSAKLRMFNLDFVSNYFLGRGKHPISAKTMFVRFDEMVKTIQNNLDNRKSLKEMAEVVAYCLEDSILVIELYQKIGIWYYLTELSNVAGVNIVDLYVRGEQIRCYSCVYNECYKQGFVLSNPRFYDYFSAGGFVNEPMRGLWEYVFNQDFSSLYPSIMQAYNLCMTTFVPKEMWHMFNEEDMHTFDIEQDEPADKAEAILNTEYIVKDDNEDGLLLGEKNERVIKGAKITRRYTFKFVKKHIREGIMPYLEKNWVADRSSVKKLKKNVDKDLAAKTEEAFNLLKHIIGNEEIERIRIERKQGKIFVVELIVEELQRIVHEAVTLEYVHTINTILSEISILIIQSKTFEQTQLSYKILANSAYGFTGVKMGYLPCLPITMCVTYIGRKLVQKAGAFFEKEYAHMGVKIVYGDTDSTMVALQLKGDEDMKAIGQEMADKISGRDEVKDKEGNVIKPAIKGIFESPLKMEFEHCARGFFIDPKMYCKLIRDFDNDGNFMRLPNGKYNMTVKGILSARKTLSKFTKNTYNDALEQIMDRQNFVVVLRTLIANITKLFKNQIPIDDLTMVQGYGTSYAKGTEFMYIFANELAKLGTPIRQGDKVEYVFVKIPQEEFNLTCKPSEREHVYKGLKAREIGQWKSDPNRAPLDYIYYAENGLMNPFDKNFGIAFGDFINDVRLYSFGYKPQFSHAHYVHFSSPVKMLSAFFKDFNKAPLDKFIQAMGHLYNPHATKESMIADYMNLSMNYMCDCLEHCRNIMVNEREEAKFMASQ